MPPSHRIDYHLCHIDNESEFQALYYLDHSVDTVWEALTDPNWLVQWLAPGFIDAEVGGRVCIDFMDSGTTIESVVRKIEPKSLLEYSWSSGSEPIRPLRWQLSPLEKGTRLELTLRIPAQEDIAKAAAGWDAHLQMMLAALLGVPIRFPLDHFLKSRREFRVALLGVHAA